MRGLDPPKRNGRAPVKSAPKSDRVRRGYRVLSLLQVESRTKKRNGQVKEKSVDFDQQSERCCVCCGVVVTNNSLGGHDGRPLSEKLWCLSCADGSAPMLAGMGGSRR
jgi:hypothetical protein